MTGETEFDEDMFAEERLDRLLGEEAAAYGASAREAFLALPPARLGAGGLYFAVSFWRRALASARLSGSSAGSAGSLSDSSASSTFSASSRRPRCA